MSIAVDVSKLGLELERFGAQGYLLSVSEDATTHVAHLSFTLDDGALRCSVSRTAASNVVARPRVSVLWPSFESGGYSMIVDGDCKLSRGTAPDHSDELVIRPVTGVLHRPAASGDTPVGTCESDCQPIGS